MDSKFIEAANDVVADWRHIEDEVYLHHKLCKNSEGDVQMLMNCIYTDWVVYISVIIAILINFFFTLLINLF